jgi:hypothetical protein
LVELSKLDEPGDLRLHARVRTLSPGERDGERGGQTIAR